MKKLNKNAQKESSQKNYLRFSFNLINLKKKSCTHQASLHWLPNVSRKDLYFCELIYAGPTIKNTFATKSERISFKWSPCCWSVFLFNFLLIFFFFPCVTKRLLVTNLFFFFKFLGNRKKYFFRLHKKKCVFLSFPFSENFPNLKNGVARSLLVLLNVWRQFRGFASYCILNLAYYSTTVCERCC